MVGLLSLLARREVQAERSIAKKMERCKRLSKCIVYAGLVLFGVYVVSLPNPREMISRADLAGQFHDARVVEVEPVAVIHGTTLLLYNTTNLLMSLQQV